MYNFKLINHLINEFESDNAGDTTDVVVQKVVPQENKSKEAVWTPQTSS